MYTPKPFTEGYLPEEDGHKIYYAQYGNPDGEVIVSLHGGPGDQSKPGHIQTFDLETYHVVVFDQRGCGKSTPAGRLEENTTQKLISDIERLREVIGVEKWFVTGGSWGSTLALAYAEQHPVRCKGLLLWGIFLGDGAAVHWAFSKPDGAGALYTDLWSEREEIIKKYETSPETAATDLSKQLSEADEERKKEIVSDIMSWEANLITSTKDVQLIDPADVDEKMITYVTVYLHYEANHFCLMDDELLENIDKIKAIPMIIAHGRLDILCPFRGAWQLAQKHGTADLVALPQSNHKFSADGMIARKFIYESFLKDHTK